MKALSLWQPFASAIVWGDKTIETRSLGRFYTGPLLICATAKTPAGSISPQLPVQEAMIRAGVLSADRKWDVSGAVKKLPHGCALAVATLTGTHYMTEINPASGGVEVGIRRNDVDWGHPRYSTLNIGSTERAFGVYEVGRYAWMLTDIQPLPEPIPCKGGQGLWNVSDELEARVWAAIGKERQAKGA